MIPLTSAQPTYITIVVGNLPEAAAFFTEKLGFRLSPLAEIEGRTSYFISLQNAIIELTAPTEWQPFVDKYGGGLYKVTTTTEDFLRIYHQPTPHPNGVIALQEVISARPAENPPLPNLPPAPPWLVPFSDFDFEQSAYQRTLIPRPDTKQGKLTAAITDRGAHYVALVLKVADMAQTQLWLENTGLLPPPGQQNTPEYLWLDNKRGYGTTFFLVPGK